ncbi:MAG: PHP domain-containing protein [Butyrivibrio sp.]|uniref:PHP domain-containing protein n=1 Tax=Butyrivibrio sp. TaxID=28121 RepID=UPI001B0479EF|nr:PHP domain-containing protein [Butyrivibrio sp.]MBO6239942.1 PHP domain-containing protein [Butyrivibrio sp.]
MRGIDLHTHSNCSDGTVSVKELIDYAHEKNLAAIALTDHDTVVGLDEAIEYTGKTYSDIEFIPGIEFSTVNEGKDVHVVGLYIDHHNPEFVKRLKAFADSRRERNEKMCKKLTEEAGLSITYDELLRAFPNAVITRAHYAKLMLDKGYVQSRQEVFDKYIGDHCKYYVPRENISPEDAIELILLSGGVPILAHPILYHMSEEKLEALVVRLIKAGLKGIEAIYSTYEPSEERQIRNLAAKYDLLISGGSDFHGANKPKIDLGVGYGKMFVPEDILENIKRAREN